MKKGYISTQSCICSKSPVLNGRLLFWEDSFRTPVSSWSLLFCHYFGWNERSIWIFQIDHIFFQFDEKILAASNKIRCVHYSWLPSSSWAVVWLRLVFLVMWILRKVLAKAMEIQLSRDNLGEQNFLGGAFSKLLESL